jgi:hypothetical protein
MGEAKQRKAKWPFFEDFYCVGKRTVTWRCGNEPVNSGATTDADDLEDEAPPARRPLPLRAQPAEPIPDEINADFLDALACERALSMARALARPSELAQDGPQAVWGPTHVRTAGGRPEPSLRPN